MADGLTGETLKKWKPYANHDFSFHVASDFIEVVSGEMASQSDPMSSMAKSVLQEINFISGGLEVENEIKMKVAASCASEAGVTKLTQAAHMIQLFAKSFSEAESVDGLVSENKKGVQELVGAISDSLKVKADGTEFVATVGMDAKNAIKIRKLVPMVKALRAGARRVDSANRSRQIILAMHVYHAANGSLPPAILTSSSGKEYSWRVALLPYLEKQELFDAYRFDEDWDSENNKKITAQVPACYHSGNMKSGPANSSYFVVVGENTPFLDGKKTSLEDIADGTARTICLLEANMGIHWADPRDIPIDTPDLLSKLGGVDDGGFNASLCDGSTMFYDKDMDPELFKAMLTSNGGELVDLSKAWKN